MRKICTLLVCFCLFSPAWGQVAGDTDEILHSFTFNDMFYGVTLDPDPKIGEDSRQAKILSYATNDTNEELQEFIEDLGISFIVALFEEIGITIPDEVVDFVDGVGDFSFVDIKPSLGVVASVDYGAYYEVNSIGDADVGVNYPVEVETIYPAPNTFGCGDEFTIETICTILEQPDMLDITPPFYNLEIGPVLENLEISIEIGLSVSFCVGLPNPTDIGPDCLGYEFNWSEGVEIYSFPIDIPELPALVNVCEDAFSSTATESDLFGCGLPGEADVILELVQEALDLFDPAMYSVATFGETQVSVMNPNIPSIPGTPLPSIPEFNGTFKKVTDDDLTFSYADEGRTLTESGNITDIANLSFDALDILSYIPAFPPTFIGLGEGIGSIDFGDISPVFQVDQNMSFEFKPKVLLDLDLGTPMAYEVHDPVLGQVSSGNSQFVSLLAGQKVVAIYPEALSDPSTVSNAYTMEGDLLTQTLQRYFTSFNIAFLQLDFFGEMFTLFMDNIGRSETDTSPDTLQNATVVLDNFQTFNKSPFTLDPEYPIVDVDYLGIEDVLNLGGGERAVVYKAIFSNGGDVRLNDMILNLDLGATFASAMSWSVECAASDQVGLNAFYDGSSDINLLGAGVSLDVGESATVEVLVKVKPEISGIDANGCFGTVDYSASTIAYGTSPIGTFVTSNIYHCTGERTADDIIAPVDLGAAVIDELSDYTIYGWEEVRFDKPAPLSKGNAGSYADMFFENVSLQSGPTFTIIGDIHTGDSIIVLGENNIVADYIQVGDIIYIDNPMTSSVTLTGALSDNSNCVSTFTPVDLVLPENNSRERVFLEDYETEFILPGDYREVRLREGSELTLTSGVYNIDRWSFMGDGATVYFAFGDGPIVINVNTWQALNRKGLRLEILGEGSTKDILINYAGVQQCKFHSAFIQGTILAPYAEIQFEEGSELQGSCYARKVNFKTGSKYVGHEFLEDLNINPACQGVLAPPARIASTAEEAVDQKLSAEVAIYPNPFSDRISIDFRLEKDAEVELQIFDLSGKMVYHQRAWNYQQGAHRISIDPISTFENGLYLVNLRIGSEIISSKIVKMSR